MDAGLRFLRLEESSLVGPTPLVGFQAKDDIAWETIDGEDGCAPADALVDMEIGERAAKAAGGAKDAREQAVAAMPIADSGGGKAGGHKQGRENGEGRNIKVL